jgi:hypothetical protein
VILVLTDEEAVAASDQQIERVARAFRQTCASNPGVSIEALSQILCMVNGPDWMSGSDMARARARTKAMVGARG